MWTSEISNSSSSSGSRLEPSVVAVTSTLTSPSFFYKYIMIDTSVAPVDITLPTPTGDNDGQYAVLQRSGSNLARLIVPGGISLLSHSNLASPLEISNDRDSVTLLYKHTPQSYCVIG
jgi:hypothetical protein